VNRRTVLVERVGVRVVERRRERQRSQTPLSATAMDAALERAEADASAVERESLAQARERHEVVIRVGELSSPGDGRLPKREIGIGDRHDGNCAAAPPAAQTAIRDVPTVPSTPWPF
jgi:hypothetical protein